MSNSAKVVLVTGASRGLGKAIASVLAKHGYRVFGTTRDPKKITEALNFKMLPLDVTSNESVQNCIKLLASETQRIDVLINNVGEMIIGSAEETSLQESSDIFQTNFFGALRTIKAVIPNMRRNGGGQIINVSSIGAIMPVPYMSSYSASKHALAAYSESIKYELAPFNIKVSLIEPSTMKMGKLLGAQPSPRSARSPIAAYNSEDVLKMIIGENASSTLLPEEVASKVISIIESKTTKFRHQLRKAKTLALLRRYVPYIFITQGVAQEFKKNLSYRAGDF